MKVVIKILFAVSLAYVLIGAPALWLLVIGLFLQEIANGDIGASSHLLGRTILIMWFWLLAHWIMLRPWPAYFDGRPGSA